MSDLLSLRLACHGLDRPRFSTPNEVVSHFGAMQSQDLHQAIWAVGSRTERPALSSVREALENASVVRTWPMRGTLHYLDPKNIGWMLEFCASRTLSGFAKRREFLGISDVHAETALAVMEKHLSGGKILTRTELTERLSEAGIPMRTQWTYHLACYGATMGRICFGPPSEKEDTFALLYEWVPEFLHLTRDEALAELARTYLRGHGGASAEDLAWWSGLGKTDCRQAFEMIRGECDVLIENQKSYAYVKNSPFANARTGVRLLAGFDEYFLGYGDRSVVTDVEHYSKLFTKNGIFFPIVLQDGRASGIWKRTLVKGQVSFSFEFLPNVRIDPSLLKTECARYAEFLGCGIGKIEIP